MKFVARAIQRAAERKLRVPADYLGRMGETSFSGFLKFLLVLPVTGHHRSTTRLMAHAARIVASQHEDCGPCVQIAVNTARDDGMSADLVRAVLARREVELSPDVLLAVGFADGVLAADGSEAPFRTRIEEQFGAAAVTELSLAIATSRLFPTIKRGMGFATSCSIDALEV